MDQRQKRMFGYGAIILFYRLATSLPQRIIYRLRNASKINKYAWLATWLVLTTLSFILLAGEGNLTQPTSKSDYRLKVKGVSNENKHSNVTDRGGGLFSMHPGAENAVKAVFKIRKSGIYRFDLSIKSGSTVGNILFTIKKNGVKEAAYEVKANQGRELVFLWLMPGDKVRVIADKNGSTAAGWGNLKVKKLIIPFLSIFIGLTWLAFLYFMYEKNQSALVLAFYIVFLLNILAEKYTLSKVVSQESVAAYGALSFMMISLSAFFFQAAMKKNKPLFALLLSVLIAFVASFIPVLFITYYLNFGVPVDKNTLFAVFQTYQTEAIEFVKSYYDFKIIGASLAIFSIIFYLFWHHGRSHIKPINNSLFILIFLSASSILAANNFNGLKVPAMVASSGQQYKKELDIFRALLARRKLDPKSISATKAGKQEIYVFVLGESHNKYHMSLYGYPRDTTPILKRMHQNGEILKFNRAYSNHTHTTPTLSLSLTEASQTNGKSYFNTTSIVEIFNAAGFETIWLTNQVLLSTWDNHISIIAQQANKVIALNRHIGPTTKMEKFDGDLLPHFSDTLTSSTKKNKIIFVHLLGSHSPYCRQFPKRFNIFNKPLSIGSFGKISKQKDLKKRVNCYDNSILYNDKVVSLIINELKSLSGVKSSLIYTADHADDVISGKGHNSGIFTWDMVQIPLFFWFSPEYKKENKTIIESIERNKDAFFSNEFLYDTLIGWAGVNTPNYQSNYDLTSRDYRITENEAVVLHSEVKYTDKKNHFYWQSVNAAYLVKNRIDGKYFPHRVNSTGKLVNLWQDGFRAFEVDLRFNDNKDGLFYVGHNPGVMGYDLETFLDSVDSSMIKKMWFDFKNLNKKNNAQALAELERLDKKYNLKGKVILESGWKSPAFSRFSANGWKTSYYLPTKKIINALDKKDKKDLKALAARISSQTKGQIVDAVSFDHRLYPFVKKYLEPLMSKNIIYHVWHGPNLASPEFVKHLKERPIFSDSRIKTFLIRYKSHFDL